MVPSPRSEMAFRNLETAFDLPALKQEIEELEQQLSSPAVWNDPRKAGALGARLARRRELVSGFESLRADIADLAELAELAGEEEGMASELPVAVQDLQERYERFEARLTLGGEHDAGNCYLTIHPGAGGTEACDWAAMLLRMYTRFIEAQGWKWTELDSQPGDEAGIKSVTLLVEGEYAYGYLRCETGVHRLVRISPFDANKRRHTSFASVFASPEIDDDIEIEIRDEDLRIDTYRSSGAGGQHVNKTSSAVRITHLPTGIVVQCQNERSQHKNRALALKVLKSRLYEREMEIRDAEQAKLNAQKKEIAWGSQIRSYVFQPYQMVKDLRTGVQTGNIQAVMDGDLEPFILAFLRQSLTGQRVEVADLE